MKIMLRLAFVFLAGWLVLASPGRALAGLDFTLHKLESGRPGPTILVVGGIQGDEPGGFNAASLLISHYRITSGRVWVVPNLNFPSIIKCSRGLHGDMNRKFASLSESDPEYSTVEKIKKIILDEQVDMVLNLHDGWGFYRPTYVGKWENPRRWGQSVIVDQERIDAEPYGNLGEIARNVVREVNQRLYEPHHVYHVKDTRTREGDAEMAKSLTFFAIESGKPAFGVEASKNFPPHLRAYYLLNALESFMRRAGVGFERKLTLTANGVRDALNSNVAMSFFGNRIFLDLRNARSRLRYFPLKKGASVEYTPSNPLLAVVGGDKSYEVYYGNRNVTRLDPQYFEYDTSIPALSMVVDGRDETVRFGSVVPVRESFLVRPEDGCRVNVIGFTQKGLKNESGVEIVKERLLKRFSVDRDGGIFRVEVYRGDKFAGMVLVDFLGDDEPLGAMADSGYSGVHAEALSRLVKENTSGASR